MRPYRTKIPISFFPGTVLGLDWGQAEHRLRIGQIRALKEQGKYEILTRVYFKAGETIGLEESFADSLIRPAPVIDSKLIPVDEEDKSK